MEKLIVHNFLSLRNIELKLDKINIVIGKQAEGKSILAKLVFFFKDFFWDYRQSPLRPKQHKKVDFDKNIVNKFRSIFPAYSWSSQDFEIEYHNQDWKKQYKYESDLSALPRNLYQVAESYQKIDNYLVERHTSWQHLQSY